MYVSIQFHDCACTEFGDRLTFTCREDGTVLDCLQDPETGEMMAGFSIWDLPLGGQWSYVSD